MFVYIQSLVKSNGSEVSIPEEEPISQGSKFQRFERRTLSMPKRYGRLSISLTPENRGDFLRGSISGRKSQILVPYVPSIITAEDKSNIILRVQNFYARHQNNPEGLVEELLEVYRELSYKEKSYKKSFEDLSDQVRLWGSNVSLLGC